MTFLRRFYVSNTALPSDNVNYKNSREGRQHVYKLYTEYHNPPFWSRQTQWSENET